MRVVVYALLLVVARFYEVNGGAGTSWTQIPGGLKSIGVGDAGVWGVGANDEIYFRRGTQNNVPSIGSDWLQVTGALRQVDVGRNVIWGVNADDDIYVGITTESPQGTGWEKISGNLKQVSVNPVTNEMWGVNSNGNIFRCLGITNTNYKGTSWQVIQGALKWVSVGQAGVWGVNSADTIFYRTGTGNGAVTSGTGWNEIAGGLNQISSGYDVVWGVNARDDIYIRLGITAANPLGTTWSQISGLLKQVSVSATTNHVWGVNANNAIYRRNSVTSP